MYIFDLVEILSRSSSNAIIDPKRMLGQFLTGAFSCAIFGGIYCLVRFLKGDKAKKKAEKPDLKPNEIGDEYIDPSSIDYAVKKIICECTSCLYYGEDDSKRIVELTFDKIRGAISETDFSPYRTEQAAWRALKNILLEEGKAENEDAIKICNEHIEKE